MTTHTMTSTFPTQDRRWDELQFRLVFGLSFVVFLGAAILSRLDPRPWGRGSRAVRRPSIFAEAREASATLAQIAFAG